MSRRHKIATLLTLAAFAAYLVVTTGFVDKERQRIYCNAIKVTICDSAHNRFVRPAEVVRLVKADNRPIIGTPIDQIDTRRLEEKLNARSVVKNAEVYTSIDGTLHVQVYQRQPVVRVLTAKGSFYIDHTGYVFPFSSAYTSYVPVVTGNIPVTFDANYRGTIPKTETLLQQIYAFSRYLQDNKFWLAQVQQLYIQHPYDIEIIPRLGNQIIQLGSFEHFEYKLQKLYTFYQKALPNEGWNKYTKIDLRFSNQVVATKKHAEN